MSSEQTSYVGDDIKVLVNVIDSTGSHVAATINTSTTRLNGFSTVPTVNTIGTGIYEIVFASVTPAPAEGDRLIAKINGDIGGTAWTEYAVPLKIVADERGTDNASTFDSTTDQVTVATNNDKTGYSISGTKTTLDALNDVAATDIVSNGAITTLSGAVVNVDTVDVTTTNSDMRGTDGANTVAPDNASIAAILVDTGTDIPASIAALNDLSSTDITNAVWDASVASHNVAGSFGRGFRQVKEGLVSIDGSVNDLSATTTSFISNLASAVDDFYNDQTIHFISGSLTGQSRLVIDYNGTTKAITVDQALSSAPANGDEFIILSQHIHSIPEIADGIWSEAQSGHTTVGTFGYYLDSQVSSAAGVTPPTAAQIADAVWDEVRSPDHVTEGTFGYYVDAQVSSAGAGGSGLYQVTVNVQNQSAQALQGARINVDGTTLTLVTDSAGQCVFNLDSGVYLLTISPPAGYDTVSGNTVVVTSADTSSTFTLTATSSASCDVPWIG